MDIKEYRIDAESFLYKIDKEYYLHFSGRKDSLNVSGIYDEFSHLFDKKNIDFIKSIKDKRTGEEKKRAAYLLKFCTEGYLEKQTKGLIDKIAEDEAKAKIVIDGREVPFRYSEIMLLNEQDKVKRDSIDDKRNKVVADNLNGTLYDYWSSVHKMAMDLGFSSYSELFSYLKEEDFLSLQDGMKKLLDETRNLYQEQFGDLLRREIKISLDESRRSDFSSLKRARKYDRFFKKENLIPVFKGTLFEMGIDLETYKNIYLDVEERENKSPRAFCSTPGIPGEILCLQGDRMILRQCFTRGVIRFILEIPAHSLILNTGAWEIMQLQKGTLLAWSSSCRTGTGWLISSVWTGSRQVSLCVFQTL